MMQKSIKQKIESVLTSTAATSFLVVLALGATFTVSIMWSVGLEIVPLIDQSRLLLLLTFYLAAILVGGRILYGAYNSIVGFAIDDIEDILSAKISKRPAPRNTELSPHRSDRLSRRIMQRNRFKSPKFVFWQILPIAAFVGWFLYSHRNDFAWSPAMIVDRLTISFIATLLVTVVAGIIVARSIVKNRSKRNYRTAFAIFQICLFMDCWVGGAIWVKYLRDFAPRVLIESRAWETPRSASVVMPAVNGILVFLDDSPVVTYLNWDEILAVTAQTMVL